MRTTYHTTRKTTVEAKHETPKPETVFKGSLDLIRHPAHGMCELDACIPIEIGEAIVALFNAQIKAR